MRDVSVLFGMELKGVLTVIKEITFGELVPR
jgi:hypothetical protein